jgi:UDP-N-acetyl-D-glucosamine dehydrogenase
VEVLNILAQSGAQVCYNDPHVPKLAPGEHGLPAGLPALESQSLTPELLAAMDCVLIAVRHSPYDIPWILRHSRLVFDAQNATRGLTEGSEKVVRL